MKRLIEKLTLCVTAICFCGALSAAEASTTPPKLEKAFISFRVGPALWKSEERFRELLDLFDRHEGVTDEISFFHSTTHAPLPLDVVRQRAAVLSERMQLARRHGYRAGINILTTIGHHEEDLSHSLSGPYTPVTDIQGRVSRGSFCPNDEDLREYIQRLYRIVTDAGPDFIWIDDDVRLAGHKPIHLTCFCDNCLTIFEKESGRKLTRESFQAELTAGPLAERQELRKAWLQHNRDTVDRLFGLIERTVHSQQPNLALGFMTGDRFYEGYDFDRWARTLAGASSVEVRWRPGGGFYGDERTSELANKSHDVGRQVSVLPPEVVNIQSEIENFPYQRLKKAAHITALEAGSHMAAGCTGAAFNVLSMYDEPLDEYEPLLRKLQQTRPFYDLLARHLGRKPLVGIHPSWTKDTAASSDLAGGNWMHFSGFLRGSAPRMFELGLPIAYSPQGASVTLLTGDMIPNLSKEQIQGILSAGVYMDASALAALNDLGYQELTGLSVERAVPHDGIEKLTDHPLNTRFAGRERDCRQSFYRGPADVLVLQDPKAHSLARIIDYEGEELGSCGMAVFENTLGGRICVGGYYPWTFLHSLSKSEQMKSVMRWLSKDRLVAYVASYHKINLWVREPDKGGIVLAFTNASFDSATETVLMVRTDRQSIRVFDMDCQETTVQSSGTDGPYRKFVLPEIGPWQMRLVTTD